MDAGASMLPANITDSVRFSSMRSRSYFASVITGLLLLLFGSCTPAPAEVMPASKAIHQAVSESLGDSPVQQDGHFSPLLGWAGGSQIESSFANYEEVMQQYMHSRQAGNYDSMISLLRQMKSVCREDLRAPVYLGMLLLSLKHYREAAGEFNQLYQRFNDRTGELNYTSEECKRCKVSLGILEANSYKSAGDFSVAASKYAEVVDLDPDNAQSWLDLAHCQEAGANKELARHTYLQIISRFPGTQTAEAAKLQLDTMRTAAQEERAVEDTTGGGLLDFSRQISVYIDSGRFCPDYKPYLRELCLDAFDQWSLASGRHFNFVVLPYSPQEEEGKQNFDAYMHNLSQFDDPVKADIHIIWAHSVRDGHTLGITFPFYPQSHIKMEHRVVAIACGLGTGGFIPPGGDYALSELKEAQSRSLRITILHEIGHALGIGHLSDSNAVMFYAAYGAHSQDSSRYAKLTASDLRALQQHYDNFRPSVLKGLQTITSAQLLQLRPAAGESGKEALRPATREDPRQQVLKDINLGDFNSAVTKLNELTGVGKKDAQLYYLRAVCFMRLKQYGRAKADYLEVTKIAPGSPVAALAEQGLAKLK